MEIKLKYWQKIALKIMSYGHVPNHIAFIMDGNRRYANNKGKQIKYGHEQGAQILKKCLLYCLEIGINVASFFCFSIENFNRKQKEVKQLMELIIHTFHQLSQMSQIIEKYHIKVKIIGVIEKLPSQVRNVLLKVEQKTKMQNKMIVNLCFAYDSIHEVDYAYKKLQEKRQEKDIFYDKDQINKHLWIKQPVDILIRTSNQSRLSNFMLVQCQTAFLAILKQNWPQLSILSIIKVLVNYNRYYAEIDSVRSVLQQEKKRYNQIHVQ